MGLLVSLKLSLKPAATYLLAAFIGFAAFIYAVVVGLFIFPGIDLWSCGYVLCWASDSTNSGDPVGFQGTAGSIIFLAGLVASMLCFLMVLRHRVPARQLGGYSAMAKRSHILRRRVSAASLLITIPLWTVFVCGLLPNTWELMTRKPYHGKPFDKHYEIGAKHGPPPKGKHGQHGGHAETNDGPSSMNLFAVTKMGAGISEFDDATLQTLNLPVGGALAKLWPDTLIFYGYLELLLLAGVFTSEIPAVARLGAKRLCRDFSVSQAFLATATVLFYVLFSSYWAFDHVYHGGHYNAPWTEVWSRVCALDAAATLGLLLLPASRTSPVLKAAGLSFESSLYMHIILGVLFLTFSALHLVLMFIRFVDLGTWTDVLPFNLGWVVYGDHLTDNFTIGMMNTIFFPCIVIYGVLPWFRRRCWELFKVAHYAFLVLIPATLIHGHGAWYFVMPGVLLWLADAVARFSQAAEKVEVMGAAAHKAGREEITELKFCWNGRRRQHSPGMICWINCPQLSAMEWHPFSLSASPLDEVQSFHIKNMDGQGTGKTFTGRLHQLVDSLEEPSQELTLNIDGPYGPLVNLESPSVLLIAGGIGITPMQSTLRYILQQGPGAEEVKRVHVVWSVSSEEMLDLFASNLQMPKMNCSVVFTLHCTSGSEDMSCSLGLVRRGRPNFQEIFEAETALGSKIFARLCGPEAMARSCSEAVAGLQSNSRALVDYEAWSFTF
eukprot:TRINITY_DN1317_c0_g1_i1.p1 TRINITY_DN1317_c0_g1~~TRINITY_DN1317_c0_g1_i1.p1  ORF type:complete len:828 (+),score=131.82 TRINITY_DN1317_c0_g1_i1:323-2485(+)